MDQKKRRISATVLVTIIDIVSFRGTVLYKISHEQSEYRDGNEFEIIKLRISIIIFQVKL